MKRSQEYNIMTDALVDKLRKVSVCVYIATEEGPAKDISDTCIAAAKRIENLTEALRVIQQAVRGDEKEEWWSLRAWLDERGIFNDDLGKSERLIESVCMGALSGLEKK